MKKTSLAQSVSISNLSDDQLVQFSKEKLLSLSLEEMRAIQDYYKKQKRNPTDIELETIAQTWSEHCKHKTFKGIIDYTCEVENDPCPSRAYDDLLKETVVKATEKTRGVPFRHENFCLSVFEDNAGIIDFDKEDGIAFKVETHNHPSALEPYGGAGTGLGGVIRDILGVGLGAKPIANSDVFCVGEFGKHPEGSETDLPPERILSGITAGVRDYGNRMGIPTVNGAVLFDEGYYANPLVFCGTVGLIPKNKIHKEVRPGDYVVTLGGRTGRDGIHGATFSSLALETGISSSVVQIGHAIMEKKAMDALLRARDQGLYRGVTDCGAGGFSSAVGELGSECGVRVDLDQAPLKYEGLAPWEIWISESQERIVFAVPPSKFAAFKKVCDLENVECAKIGTFTDSGKLELYYKDELLGSLDNKFLHKGIPRVQKKAVWSQSSARKQTHTKKDAAKVLHQLLSHVNIGSKKWIVKQYDHEVQGASVVKPFAGAQALGPSDAAVFRPKFSSQKAVAISCGINPWMGEIDPYWMAANVIDEALRNFVAVGGDVAHCAILDNFCWGNIHDERDLAGMVRASQAAHDFAIGFGVPFISGKDSLNNTWKEKSGRVISIPGTLLISAMGIVPDARKAVTMPFKKAGNVLILVGETRAEFGGSHFNIVTNQKDSGQVPRVNAAQSLQAMKAIFKLTQKDLVAACHDCSEGGLAVTLAEMAIGADLGAKIDLSKDSDVITQLFSESSSRWVLEIPKAKLSAAHKILKDVPHSMLGQVQSASQVVIVQNKKVICQESVEKLKKSWTKFSDAQ